MAIRTTLEAGTRSRMSSPVVGLSELMAHLAEGWSIEGPVYRTTDQKRNRTIFHFITWYGRTPRVVSVADGQDVQQFMASHMLDVEES